VILVDTGAFYALADRADRHHAVASACLRELDDRLATHPLVEASDYAAALVIEQRYENLSLGLTDAVSFALCDRERITTVFTFDRKDFGAFRPARGRALRLVPPTL
jgi:predicted nucleic acid-binding protein